MASGTSHSRRMSTPRTTAIVTIIPADCLNDIVFTPIPRGVQPSTASSRGAAPGALTMKSQAASLWLT